MKHPSKERKLYMMGTVIDLFVDHEDSEVIMETLYKKLKIYEKRFSANNPDSELMQVNHCAGIKEVVVHPDLYKLIEIGKEQSLAKNSFLNVAIGPLVQTWRIGFKDAQVPKDETIKNLLHLSNPKMIELNPENHSVFLKEKGMLIDLGALAKGFMADLVIEYLKSINVQSAMINLGGNVKILGHSRKHDDGYWRVGIQNPNQMTPQNIVILKIINQSVVTSGIYERVIKNEGKSYHHILDSKTGYPLITDVISLTIVSNSSLDGEIWTTRLFGKKSTEIIPIINSIEGIECLIITEEGKILSSKLLNKQ